jgi:MYXO-CTERM domain-containing protein
MPGTTVGGFTVSGSAIAGTTGSSATFNSQTIQVSTTTGGLLDVYFTITDVPTQGLPLQFTSTFTSNQQNATSHAVVESTYLDNANTAYGLSTLLGSATLTNALLETAGPIVVTTTPAGTVSLTELYQIQLIGCGTQPSGICTGNLTIDLSAVATTVPANEPAALALLGLGLLGVGAIKMRRRPGHRDMDGFAA